jgi:hypothetical protein
MQEQGLLEESPQDAAAAEDPRRRVFRLTPLGRRTAQAEARRLADAARAASAVGLLPGEGSR